MFAPRERHLHRYLNQQNFVLVLAGIALAAIVGYFIYEFKFFLSPALEIHSPDRDIMTKSTVMDVAGVTDPDADLTVNGRPLFSGEDGAFAERIHLVTGVNRLEFQAKSRSGEMATVIRYVIVQ